MSVQYKLEFAATGHTTPGIIAARANAGNVVTKNANDFGLHNTKSRKDLIRIPAFAFLYLLGHAEKNGYRGIG